MSNTHKSVYTCLIILVVFTQCSCGIFIPLSNNKDKLNILELRMEKKQVNDLIGSPDEVRGSVQNVDGDIVTVWQYELIR